jgi:hypothetical protein
MSIQLKHGFMKNTSRAVINQYKTHRLNSLVTPLNINKSQSSVKINTKIKSSIQQIQFMNTHMSMEVDIIMARTTRERIMETTMETITTETTTVITMVWTT